MVNELYESRILSLAFNIIQNYILLISLFSLMKCNYLLANTQLLSLVILSIRFRVKTELLRSAVE